jgi:uncharacterized protein (TIGR02266 family)
MRAARRTGACYYELSFRRTGDLMSTEKRLHPRVNTDFELTIQNAGTFHWTSLRNLSAGGVCVQTDAPQEAGSIVSMQLTLPGDQEMMDIQGRIIWVRQASSTAAPGMGIEFTGISAKHQQKIINFVGNILALLGRSA